MGVQVFTDLLIWQRSREWSTVINVRRIRIIICSPRKSDVITRTKSWNAASVTVHAMMKASNSEGNMGLFVGQLWIAMNAKQPLRC